MESGQLNLTFPVMFNPVTWDAHVFPVYFGGAQISDDNTIISVPAVQLVYFVVSYRLPASILPLEMIQMKNLLDLLFFCNKITKN